MPRKKKALEPIGERIKRLRLEQGISQRELSRRSGTHGVSNAYLCRLEAGSRRPSGKAIRLLAAGLGVSPHELEFGKPDPLTRCKERAQRLQQEKLMLANALADAQAELAELKKRTLTMAA